MKYNKSIKFAHKECGLDAALKTSSATYFSRWAQQRNIMGTLEEALEEVQKNNRVCPQPTKWQELYELLPEKKRKGNGWEPAVPLILAAWWDTPALPKILRLREHIEWAEKHGCLDEVYRFLTALAEDDWHHIGD